jgi:lipoprotein-releasing system permease protein
VSIKGVETSYFNEQRLAQITFETKELEESNLKGIAISRYTANKLNVKIGDRVALMIVPDTSNAVPRPVLVRVEAIFHSGYDQLDQMLSYVDISYAETLFTSTSARTCEIIAQTDYMERLTEVISSINTPMNNVSTWDQHNLSVYTNFITSKQMILIILLLVVVVAAFYTSSVAQQMIQDDIKPISTAKLIGMSDSMVRKSVFLSVCLVTFVGMILGVILGIAIGYSLGPALSKLSNIGLESLSFYLLDFDVHIPWASVLVLSAFLLVLSNVAVWLTLRKTRRITPIQLFSNS